MFLAPLAQSSIVSAAETAYRLPLFRMTAAAGQPPVLQDAARIVLLGDRDFAPFSFVTTTGEAAGLAVDLARAACAEARIACDIRLRPFAELLPALASGQAQAVIDGPRPDEAALDQAIVTRPYFQTLARFAIQSGNPTAASDPASLVGKRLGAVKDTAHAAWLATYYPQSELQLFASDALAQEALRTGAVDALFGDALRLIFWLNGRNSANCCKLLDGAYVDRGYFSRNLVFLVRKDRGDLRRALDYGLDQAQEKGETERIFLRYVPASPW